MQYWGQILFFLLLIVSISLFIRNLRKIYLNIQSGKEIPKIKQKKTRWLLVLKIALGQGRMNNKPLIGVLHFLVYIGFFIINLEFIEILIDGLSGSHRFLSKIFSEKIYQYFTAVLEIFAVATVLAVSIFFIRRNFLKIPRLSNSDLKGWAKKDANWILLLEFLMMWAFLQTNATDAILQNREIYPKNGYFPISESLFSGLQNLSTDTLVLIERGSWWFHFIGILFFLNYLCFSKHLHIILAFPNIWYSFREKKGEIPNISSITQEIKYLLNPNSSTNPSNELPKLGAEDVFDLNKIQLLNAYSCVECGRCTEVCPAYITGKKLSPRKIMMSVRDRIENLGKNNAQEKSKKLIGDYISHEEIWACTTCNACSEACPLYIDPASIIIELRRFLVMEKSSSPNELNKMTNNIDLYSTPWAYSENDRENWIKE